jgi:hypothetical protein
VCVHYGLWVKQHSPACDNSQYSINNESNHLARHREYNNLVGLGQNTHTKANYSDKSLCKDKMVIVTAM